MVHKVCQSIEYFLQDDMGLLGALSSPQPSVLSLMLLRIGQIISWSDNGFSRL